MIVATVYLHQLAATPLLRQGNTAESCQLSATGMGEHGGRNKKKPLVSATGLPVLLKVACRDPGALCVSAHAQECLAGADREDSFLHGRDLSQLMVKVQLSEP